MSKKGENIYKRKDGRWEARYIKGYREDGSAMWGYLYASTYAEVKAKKKAAAVESYQYILATDANSTPLTVSKMLDGWLSEQKRTVKESTYTRYFLIVEKHIKPELGGLKLKQLSSSHTELLLTKLSETGRLDGGGGLSAKTVKDIFSVLKLAVRYGVDHQYLPEGKIRFSETRSSKREITILSTVDRIRLEKYVSEADDPCKFGILLCLYTGIRIGEVCALRWKNIDFSNAVLNITSTVQRIVDTDSDSAEKTKLLFGEPKTESSYRTIPLPSFLITKLKKLSLGHNPDDFILSGYIKPIEPRSYENKYKKYLKECGASDYTFHTLRHTFATRCVEEGFDIKSLSEILGHSNVKTTLDRYVHPTMDLKRSHMEKLAQAML